MTTRKTHTIIVNAENNDRIEYEYDYSDRVWNVYAIDGMTNYPIQSGYAGCKAECMEVIEEAKQWFNDTVQRENARRAYEMFGNK